MRKMYSQKQIEEMASSVAELVSQQVAMSILEGAEAGTPVVILGLNEDGEFVKGGVASVEENTLSLL